jgi:cysteine desulfurase family protein (TIGR01976 family)
MFDPLPLREQFPALRRQINGRTPIFLDGPGGTQVPQRVADAVGHYLTTCNANCGGLFTTSRESDAVFDEARRAAADFVNAPSADEIVFGQNMTSLTFHLSRSFGRTLRPGDAVAVTRLDHDANVRPWALAARDAGAEVRFVDVRPDDCTLDLDSLKGVLADGRVKLLAVGVASNAVGTRNDVTALGRLAHAAGALIYLDAVHYAPHGPIDVRAWDCDFLACSVYKFFGPHVGVLWGRRRLLEELTPYKVEPASDAVPDRWMTGTQNHEGLAGLVAAVDYLASLGRPGGDRRRRLEAAMAAIQSHEERLTVRLLTGLAERPRFRVWGVADPRRLGERVPTVSITATDRDAADVARHLAEREIYAWNGDFYAWELVERLGLRPHGGLVRLGLVHYNTADEVERLLAALDEIV